VRRIILSEKDRVGIGTFQPKDEKNQDSTELTGDINYRKIAEYGSDSDPRAFNFDGELNIANRGMSSSSRCSSSTWRSSTTCWARRQEHVIKPKKFAQTYIDEVIIGHTNEPEYKKLQSNEMMEAFRDRTIKIDVPYNIRLDDEIKIYQKDFNPSASAACTSRRTRSRWRRCGRCSPGWKSPRRPASPDAEAQALQRQEHPGFTEDSIKELKEEAPREGMQGISPRYIQDKISNAWSATRPAGEVHQPLHGHERAGGGPRHHSLITDEETQEALPRAARRGQGGVRRHHQGRGPAGHQRRRGRHQAAVRQLHRERPGLHPAREGPQQVHRQGRGARTSG
jgi:serine protein kinase